ncbi:MAG TPA: hypothetical protein VIO59_02940 [Rhodanobacter sp.]
MLCRALALRRREWELRHDRIPRSNRPSTALGNANPTDQAAKQLSRAFSAFVLHKLLDITPQAAAASVVDDFNDKGIDAIHYHAPSETLYLLQTKLKESEQFKQEDALPFCEGIRLLLKQDFTAFNGNVLNRKADIEGALDACSHIKPLIDFGEQKRFRQGTQAAGNHRFTGMMNIQERGTRNAETRRTAKNGPGDDSGPVKGSSSLAA